MPFSLVSDKWSSYSSDYYIDAADPEPDQYTINLLGTQVHDKLT